MLLRARLRTLAGIVLMLLDMRRFDFWVSQPGLSFADCYHAVLVERLKLPAIISFGRGFDRLPTITRREP